MAELKTQNNDGSIDSFLNQVDDEKKPEASFIVRDLMQEVAGEEYV